MMRPAIRDTFAEGGPGGGDPNGCNIGCAAPLVAGLWIIVGLVLFWIFD